MSLFDFAFNPSPFSSWTIDGDAVAVDQSAIIDGRVKTKSQRCREDALVQDDETI